MNRPAADPAGTRADRRVPRPITDPPRTAAGSGLPEAAPALRVLVIDGESDAADGLVQELRRHGYRADSVGSGAEALTEHHQADFVLLDLDLPDLDGLEVCRRIRLAGDVPIITVTARGSELDRVLGLQAGSDDYVVKPFGLRELLARMEAVLRRSRPRPAASQAAASQVVTHGPLRLDAARRESLLDGRPLDLTPKEFDLLHLLVSQPETIHSRRRVMSQVWNEDSAQRGRTIDTHVSSLRGKLGSSDWIVTVRGVGFRLGEPWRMPDLASADSP
ncbi:response regulator transcription factor [Streptomyces sp. CSDS2]|uniref:response regulator transcription factor n=1 Tax=Streptomyces sp. CSDS2 TaxID=3055051 RepID=UPI0025B173E3|nr:response regulator transcription factor [Streptomyces sp. CSDS2]MDN3259377.1 response regulator transcription factor [Streptomyces sp. CSDS2]